MVSGGRADPRYTSCLTAPLLAMIKSRISYLTRNNSRLSDQSIVMLPLSLYMCVWIDGWLTGGGGVGKKM